MNYQKSYQYVIRDARTEPQEFLDLHRTVWGSASTEEWFNWCYESNPYVDEVPLVAAEYDGKLVGTEPCIAFRVGTDRRTALAYQPANWMVHPDHRRRGVFSMMTEELLRNYSSGPPEIYFNFPTESILPGLEKYGWKETDTLNMYLRIQNPHRFASDLISSDKPISKATLALSRMGSPFLRGSLKLLEKSSKPTVKIDVRRTDQVPAKTLSDLYERSKPGRIHVVRDEAFYRWRFDNPRWNVVTYLAYRQDKLVGSLIAVSPRADPGGATWLLDALPLDGSAQPGVYDALVREAISDASDAYIVKSGGEIIPRSVLYRHGFVSTGDAPLSRFSQGKPMVVRPAARDPEEPYRFDGRELTDPSQWLIDLAGREII